jgi:hypothetical protein
MYITDLYSSNGPICGSYKPYFPRLRKIQLSYSSRIVRVLFVCSEYKLYIFHSGMASVVDTSVSERYTLIQFIFHLYSIHCTCTVYMSQCGAVQCSAVQCTALHCSVRPPLTRSAAAAAVPGLNCYKTGPGAVRQG